MPGLQPESNASFACLSGPQGGNCPHHPRLCYGKTGTRGVHRPQFIWEMYNHAASSPWAAISALSEKAKQLLPCKLYLISLKNVVDGERQRDAWEETQKGGQQGRVNR